MVGADRVAANGDTANKIGTYQLAVLAKHHGVAFYVAAPTTTVDLGTLTGDGIPIEERKAEEMASCGCEIKKRVPPEGDNAKTQCGKISILFLHTCFFFHGYWKREEFWVLFCKRSNSVRKLHLRW